MTPSDIADGTLVLWLEAAQVSRGVHRDGYGHPDREGVGTGIANRGYDTVRQSLMSNRSDPYTPGRDWRGPAAVASDPNQGAKARRGSGGRIGAGYAAGSSRTVLRTARAPWRRMAVPVVDTAGMGSFKRR
jgi:hypothetical protein